MRAGSDNNLATIAWNGVRMTIPACWETRVSAPCHLIFEDEFLPVLQLRWHRHSGQSRKEVEKMAAAFTGRDETAVASGSPAFEWRQLEKRFQRVACSGNRDGTATAGIFGCPRCHTLFQFQIFSSGKATATSIGDCLATLACHGHAETLWRLQDFSLSTPQSFRLADYSFLAGLTRLAFTADHLNLETCKLAPADDRLNRQSLAEILLALTATPDLIIREHTERESCEGFRSPGIAGRMLLRLRRAKPFVQAKIWHDRSHNRLLAVVLTDSRPIPGTLLSTLAESYEVI
jgi:hypothetical protein